MLSFKAADVFPGRVADICLDSGQTLLDSHGAYWNNDAQFWAPLAEYLK
jgi:hypothetical protein